MSAPVRRQISPPQDPRRSPHSRHRRHRASQARAPARLTVWRRPPSSRYEWVVFGGGWGVGGRFLGCCEGYIVNKDHCLKCPRDVQFFVIYYTFDVSTSCQYEKRRSVLTKYDVCEFYCFITRSASSTIHEIVRFCADPLPMKIVLLIKHLD